MEQQNLRSTRISKTPLLLVASVMILTGILFQNMSLAEFAALNISGINETVRQNQARELLGTEYAGSPAQSLEGQEFLNFLVYRKLQAALGPAWESRLPAITRVLIEDSKANQFDPVFILAIIETESHFDPNVVGTVGEIGLMQVRPTTAEWIANHYAISWQGRDSLFDPATNIRIGVKYLSHLRAQFNSSATHYVPAYNMGPSNVRRLERNIASTGMDLRVVRPEYAVRVLTNYNSIYREISSAQSRLSVFAATPSDSLSR